MVKRLVVPTVALIAALGISVHAQQKPADQAASTKTAEQQAADEKAGRENLVRMAAEQAEAVARAQQKVAEEAAKARRDADLAASRKRSTVVPLDIEIVISRYQGDKKVSSLPFALTVNAPNSAWTSDLDKAPLTQLRMGGQVPLPTMAPALGPDGKPVSGITGGGPIQYRDVGTSIDARGRWLEAQPGAYELWISVQEDAVATPQGAGATSLPVLRSFRVSNNLVLRDGQTRQFTAAADRITGEVVKVDVTLKVVK